MGKRIHIILLLITFPVMLFGQQTPFYTLQESVQPGMNPAYVGNPDVADLVLLTRQQWVGFEGAPKGYFIAANVPLQNPNTGVGIDLQRNSTEPYSQTGLFASYSYTLTLPGESHLSMGLRGGMNIYQVNITELSSIDAGDPLLAYPETAMLKANFGAGLHYSAKSFYVDMSMPLMLRNELVPGSEERLGQENRTSRNVLLMTGLNLKLSEGIVLRPSLGAWYAKQTPLLFDMRISALLIDKLEFGMAYRLTGALAAYFQVLAINDINIGYAYELPLSNDYHLSSGTHEICFSMDFQFLKGKTTSPRRF